MGRTSGAVWERAGTRRALPVAWRRGKRFALVLAATWCVVLGIGMTATIVDQGSLGKTTTPILLAAVAMLVLPGLTGIALRIDARERRKQGETTRPVRQPAPRAIAHKPHSGSLVRPGSRREANDRHTERPTDRHQRSAPARSHDHSPA